MRSIHEVLRVAHARLPEAVGRPLARLFGQEELLASLASRLLVYTRQGVPIDRQLPHLAEECTPPLDEAFAFFRPALVAWHDNPDSPLVVDQLSSAIGRAGAANLLVLLGQRCTPGSITDARAIPPVRTRLLATASRPFAPGDPLTVAARALTKHGPRGAAFWGEPTGTTDQKNAHARERLDYLLEHQTWWNIFGHYQHGEVYEVRVPSGHGARWTRDGNAFIGLVEPFDSVQRPDGGATR